jgi:beta-galactosidase
LIQTRASKTTYTVSTSEFSFTFDRARGSLKSWIHNSTSLLSSEAGEAALGLGFSRAPTDNDRPSDFPTCQRYGIDALNSQLRSFSLQRISVSEVELVSRTYISPPILAWGFDATITYTVKGDGSLSVKVKLTPVGGKAIPDYLPRIGLDLRANTAFSNASWFGRGPGESYPDKNASQKIGIWNSVVKELGTGYEVPQENGNRMDTRWVKLSEAGHGCGVRATRLVLDGEGEAVASQQAFAWQAGRYKDHVLEKARHPRDLVGQEEDVVLWRLDVATAGVGSAACGPGVGEKYRVKCEEVGFGFRLESVSS